jgi:hypothetical protein
MSRIWHMLLGLLPASSLILCAASATVWVRSYWLHDYVDYYCWRQSGDSIEHRSYGFGSFAGRFALSSGRSLVKPEERTTTAPARWEWWTQPYFIIDQPMTWGDWWFEFNRWSRNPGENPRYIEETLLTVIVPYWTLVTSTAIPPGWWLATRLKRWRRGAAGRCLRCGYDLRATPTRCPECGTVVQRPPASPDHPAHAPRDRDPSGAGP